MSGVDFLDTAEMYAVPTRAETFTLTETELGFDGPVLNTRWRVDLNEERTELEVIG